MAYHQGYGGQGSKHRVRGPIVPPAPDPHQLFDDTSAGFPHAQGTPASGIDMGFNTLLADPMANVAVAYGSSIASQSKDIVHKEIHRFMSVNRLKYFFAVDTAYVTKKLALLLFPYAHQNWEVRYSRDTPLTPRQDINAPDLYIPTMAFITYILLAGIALGLQQRMILAVLGGLLFGSDGYYVALAWTSCALMYFLARSLRMKLHPSLVPDGMGHPRGGGRGQTYVTLGAAACQPLIVYWLTFHLVR
ncbi:protein YIF1A isoform X2 [Chelonia mydas]|uniref:protein YIF1A isoform X2 n=1 Tax=Chelonia mydas TaxID=8469 RepID=UPI0018A1EED9|nr:protein YIF1A isoform X2 [Chelonia mydas]